MIQNHQTSPFRSRRSQLFTGIRFLLSGFDPIKKSQVSQELVDSGAVNAGQYGPNCTHVIVDKLLYDDPVCVVARRDGKIVVSSLWVDHSFYTGALVDTTSVMYMPARDLNGIPGAESLVICLTGYLREDREDIMTMVKLMGAQFSKPLVANQVTHLICYKFEGEKYLLAKKMKRIKIINHRWLEDCLKAWEILNEADYSKSGYELEMEAEAKDSEEEPEAVTARQNQRKISTPPDTINTTSYQFHNPNEIKNKHLDTDSVIKKAVSRPSPQKNTISPSVLANKSPQNEAGNIISATRATSPAVDMKSKSGSAKRLSKFIPSDAFNMSSSLAKKVGTETSNNGPTFCTKDEQNGLFSGKRKAGIACSSFELQKTSLNNDVESASREIKNPLTETSPSEKTPYKIAGRKSLSSKGKNVTSDVQISKTSTLETEEVDAVQRPEKKFKETSQDVDMVENVIQSSSAVNSDLQKSSNQNLEINEQSGGPTSKSARRKVQLTKKNTANKKGSASLKYSLPRNDNENLMNDDNLNKVSQVAKSGSEINIEVNRGLQIDNMSGNKSLCMDDDTEPPEDKDEVDEEKHVDGEPEKAVDVVMQEQSEGDLHAENENLDNKKTSKGRQNKKGKKNTARLVNTKELVSDNNNERPEIREESTPNRAASTKRNANDLEKSVELQVREDVCNDADMDIATADVETENVVKKKETKRSKRPLSKTKVTDVKAVNKKAKQTSSRCDMVAQDVNMHINVDNQSTGKKEVIKRCKELPKKNVEKRSSDVSKDEPMWFILTGHKLQRREFQQIIRRLKGRVCKVSHQWSYQATHFIVPDPIRRTEKFFAAAASGRWILKTDYLSASNQAGKFVAEEPYEWHQNGLSEDGQINLEAPRKWRLLKEKTGHGAFYGMKIIIYGDCIAPTLDTLKRAVKSGDGTILATSPPYTRFLNTGGIDFAVVSPGMPHVDIWVQEFLRHEIPCVYADYLVEYVCKPGYPLEKHVQYDTNAWAERSYNKFKKQLEEDICEPKTPNGNDVACEVCGSRDRGDEMLICGDEMGLIGCGSGTHIDCCDPPLEDVPEEDWFCVRCSKKPKSKKGSKRKGSASRA